MKYGLPKATIEQIRGVFARFPEIDKAVLYGSRAKGTYQTGSDIDLTLYCDALTPDLRDKIVDALDDLLLPYTIDLSLFDELDHAKLREHIERVGVVFYEQGKPVADIGEGWQIKSLGDVCDVIGGGTPSKDKAHASFYTGDIRWATVRDMKTDLISETEFKITPEAVKASATNIIPKGNVIIATRVGLGKVCRIEYDTAINQDLRGIIPKEASRITVPFLFWWMKSVAPVIVKEGRGATVQGVTLPFIKSLPIPLPPLSEQKRIVSILDEAFEGIATAIANAKKNLANAREVFESTLQSELANREGSWVHTKLGEEINLLTGFPFKSVNYTNSDMDVRLLRGDNIIQGSLRWDDVKRWPAIDAGIYKRYYLDEGDIVLAMDRPWVNAGLKRAQIASEDLPCLLVQRTARIRVMGNLDSRFLLYLINSQEFITHILGVQTGIGVPHISGQQIKDFQFFKPPLNQQHLIVAKLDALSTETKKLESIYQQKLTTLDQLKKSILNQAFSGQLH
uniref:Restriction modification system DNA specificity-containing protein (Modular protein) n=1 Tax=Candidatus Nitrotoga fabula TaxID=2182327 RepID=A0A2X0QV98_9PROT|nr:Restriction modification system DNA specificity-containing protein (modular protein) [Candidatus Nitrotoga fabula]